MKSDQQKICHLISDAVTVMCKNGLDFQHDLKLEGVIGITLDNSDVFVVHINEAYNQHKEPQTPPMRTGAGDVEATTLTELPGLMWGMTRRGDKQEHHSARKRKIPLRANKQLLSAAAASTVSVIPSSPENTSPTARDIVIEPRFENSVDDDNITEPDLNTVRKLNVSNHNHEKVGSESVDLDINQDNGAVMPLINPSDIKTDNDYIEPHAKRAHLESCPVNIVNTEQPSTSDLNELTTDATVELLTDIKQEFSGDDISTFQLPQLENVEGATNWSQTQLDNSNEFTAGAATDAVSFKSSISKIVNEAITISDSITGTSMSMNYLTPQDNVSQKLETKKPDDSIVPLQQLFSPHSATLQHSLARSKRRGFFNISRPLTRHLVVLPTEFLDRNVVSVPSRTRLAELREANAIHYSIQIRRQQNAEELHKAFKVHTMKDVIVLKPIICSAGRPFKELSPSPEFPSALKLLEWYRGGIYVYVMVASEISFPTSSLSTSSTVPSTSTMSTAVVPQALVPQLSKQQNIDFVPT